MKKILILLLMIVSVVFAKDDIYLIIRADDIGSSHAANVACIESYKNGIARSVEVMVPCAWFLEAAEMLKETPNYDVGVHLTFTAEWQNVKWRPLTWAPSLVDSNGFFNPIQKDWANSGNENVFWKKTTDLKEVEQECRAQIELALKHIPQVSHLSNHMGVMGAGIDPRLAEMYKKLAKEYNLDIDPGELGFKGARWGADGQDSFEVREQKLIDMLENLEPGKYLLVEHPGMNVPEMQAHGHKGYDYVATHRDAVTKAFISEKVKKVIEKRGIKLISYADAKNLD